VARRFSFTPAQFAASPRISEIVVALRKRRDRWLSRTTAEQQRCWTREQGQAGQVENIASFGREPLSQVSAGMDDIISYDAVRPFVTLEIIMRSSRARKIWRSHRRHPAVDTIKKVERTADGALITTRYPARARGNGQTPQGFASGSEESLRRSDCRRSSAPMKHPW
jgi:2-C-methyl-D-erythritol 4-phosphate cytidylyltransferase